MGPLDAVMGVLAFLLVLKAVEVLLAFGSRFLR